MRVSPLKRVAAIVMVVLGLGSVRAAAPDYRVIAYVREGTIESVTHPEKLTHINFAFGKIDAQGAVVLPHAGAASQLAQLVALKSRNPRLGILLSVGGWTADGFSDAALSAESRERFAR